MWQYETSLSGQSMFGEASTLEERPDLCHKCGRCCRSATTINSPARLKQLADEGYEDAKDFLEVFEPYPSIEAARAVVPEQVDNVLKVAQDREFSEDLTFYHCRYVTPEGLCGIYERRPRFCRSAPEHGWSVMPPGCGYEGWQFEQREKHKNMIRNLKTSLYQLQQLSPDGVHHPTRPDTKLADLEAKIEEKIAPWRRFGADLW